MSSAPVQPKPSVQRRCERRADTWRATAVCGFLVAAVLLVFSQALRQGFLNYDDGFFVYDEPHVSGGLSWSGLAWAFTNGPVGEWYPLTMLSHMLDCQLFGLNPAGHHLTNLLLHAASAVTLFLVLWRMTGALWPSALVAALFALHPLRVESVAWVAERRDVLSGLFFMLTLGAYGQYVRQPRSLGRYLAVVGFFALGLMAKSMLVTLPPLVLLLDFWPLRRFGRARPDTAAPSGRQKNIAPSERQKNIAPSERQKNIAPTSRPAPFPWRPVVDKLPLFALAIADAGVTMFTHSVLPADPLSLPERLANAAVSYVAYLGQLFVPVGLSPFYSHPEAGIPAWQVAAAVALLSAITAAAVITRRSYPYCFVGWFWYVGMLTPVLGLTMVGSHARADRYTYLSQIGLYIALVWGVKRLGASWPARRWVFGIGAALALTALMACSWRQTGYWRDEKTLWTRALACDPRNVTARFRLGVALEEKGEDGAAAQYLQALELGPNERNIYYTVRAEAHIGLGMIAARNGDDSDALAHFSQALKLVPSLAFAHLHAGQILTRQGRFDEAIANYRLALKVDSRLGLAHRNLAGLLAQKGEVDEAIVHFRRAIDIDPVVARPYYDLAQLLRQQGKMSEAARYDKQGLEASRRFAETQNLRGSELARQGKLDEAIAQFETAIAAFPDYAQAHNNLADALALQGDLDGAVAHYRAALAIDPNFAPAVRSLDRLLNH